MPKTTVNNIKTIEKVDPYLPKDLNFKDLRKEGLKHIGELSGKIWTDHNAHDPGITILEVLVYALMDLGYRTNLPFTDILTPEVALEDDDNFITPLEALTINPVTVTDFRKLLLDIFGVRNAWLEPVESPSFININRSNNQLDCVNDPNENCKSREEEYLKIHINGLYKVFIEKDTTVIQNISQEERLIQNVKEILNAHRNLCEDFVDICILKPLDIGVCVKVEVVSGVDSEKVYKAIYKGIKEFIQPELKYYTLQELLDKDKSIDEIFEGRSKKTKSFGFIDTLELEKLQKRKAIYLSDVYTIVLSQDGVRKIKSIEIKADNPINADNADWIEGNSIPLDCVPVFSEEKTCIDLFTSDSFIELDTGKIHKSFSFFKKFELPFENLDCNVELGRHRNGLNTLYSIQNDFPVVYGIGDDGLSERASLLRKTQALQLKSYLLFYDQLLANYAAQLTNIRSLFSLKKEVDRTNNEKRTYFTELPNAIPGIEKLVKFYGDGDTTTSQTILAQPVLINQTWKDLLQKAKEKPRTEISIASFCGEENGSVPMFTFPSAPTRNIYINQLIDIFLNEKYTIEIIKDRFGCLFLVYPESPGDMVLVGIGRYKTEAEARNEALNVAFLMASEENYNRVTEKSTTLDPDQHYFGIVYNPISYIKLIEDVTENKETYRTRRKQFLDHLLARFGESFTDYVHLKYNDKHLKEHKKDRELEDQSNYLSNIPDISRNRGRAFNYLDPSWNTLNVSGFEKRASLLSGIAEYGRRNLCNFEVTPCFRLFLNDASGALLFKSSRSYESREDLVVAGQKILMQLRDSNSYPLLEKQLNGFDSEKLKHLFSAIPAEDNIIITKYHYSQQLIDANGVCVKESKNVKIPSAKVAINKRELFINGINSPSAAHEPKDTEYRLIELNKKNQYLNTIPLETHIEPVKSWKWHMTESVSGKRTSSKEIFSENDDVWKDLLEEKELSNTLTTHDTGLRWRIELDTNHVLESVHIYPDAYKAVAAWRQAKTLGSNAKNLIVEEVPSGNLLVLKNEKKKTIAKAISYEAKSNKSDDLITRSCEKFKNKKTSPSYLKESSKYGFRIPEKGAFPTIESYCVYDTPKEAIEQLEVLFKVGLNRKNYLESGDEGNPEYNFILKNRDNTFMAVPVDHFETASDRKKSLNATVKFLKNNKVPVQVKEQPRHYRWMLYEGMKCNLESDRTFDSKKKAQEDLDLKLREEVSKKNPLVLPHCSEFKVHEKPVEYKYVYNRPDNTNKLSPVFISNDVYNDKEKAKVAYTEFIKDLPSLRLKTFRKKGVPHDFELLAENHKKPIVIQYKKGRYKAALEDAKYLSSYLQDIYTKEGTPRLRYIKDEMIENQDGLYEWRFYKKNAPIAKSPYCCDSEETSAVVKSKICGLIPPVQLGECPPKEIVICPAKDPTKYHYRVCFEDDEGHYFELISYKGYNTFDEASTAWEKNWLQIIELARDPYQYENGGKISLIEEYLDPDSTACLENTFIAVIPEKQLKTIPEDKLKDHYRVLATLFPIYTIDDENDEKCDSKYKYRVVIREALKGIKCKLPDDTLYSGHLIWDSVDCFDSIEEVLNEYKRFYTLAGTPNNCRILCEKGCYSVGLVEILVESSCEFKSEAEAWDDAFPPPINEKDPCGECPPGGVREFIYAAEDIHNYIPICQGNYWKFKVVAPEYFVVNHECSYNSELRRDEQMSDWVTLLDGLNWDNYLTIGSVIAKKLFSKVSHFSNLTEATISRNKFNELLCELIHELRECLKECEKGVLKSDDVGNRIKVCLKEKFRTRTTLLEMVEALSDDIQTLEDIANYFPVYKTEKGYCFRLYWPENIDNSTEKDGLQPCGCGDDKSEEPKFCATHFPFVSSNCYSCCEEAMKAFVAFCKLIEDEAFDLECVSISDYGPYSFRIVNTKKELGYHPQQYSCYQEVIDAIDITKSCVSNTGMHLIEHILLRPKDKTECINNDHLEDECCLLPICPDYKCPIDWLPNKEKDDPCPTNDDDYIHYLPGSDPYSFWATLALPAWDKRFRTLEARKLFEKVLYKEVPALVGLHILWLSPRDMCRFEDCYRKWLEWKYIINLEESKDNLGRFLCDSGELSANCTMVKCITDLKSELACPTIPGSLGDCDCPEDIKTYDPCCLPEESEGSIFWNDCPIEVEPIDDTIFITHSAFTSVDTSETSKKTKSESKPIEELSLAQINKLRIVRKEAYQKNILAVSKPDIKKTKSFELVDNFINKNASITGFQQLVNFYKQYSLQKDNDVENYMELIKNASWHFLDDLILEKKPISNEDINKLKRSFEILKDKGLNLKELEKSWKNSSIKSAANIKTLNQIKKILK